MLETADLVSVTAVLFLIAGVAVEGACGSAGGGSDGGSFQRASGLMADDAAGRRAEQAAGGGSALGVRSGGSRAV